MSRQQSAGIGKRHVNRRLRVRLVGVRRAGAALAVTVGLAACGGDDDDAADSTAVEVTAAETTLPAEITGAPGGSEPDSTDATTEATSGDSALAGSEPETAGTEATATDGAGSDTTEAPDDAAAAAVAADETSDTGADASGPTTTGPECEFAENSSLPLERCDMGPAVVVVQLLLQADGYEIATVDGEFGDQTLAAVRAFQEEEGLEVDGIVGLETWTALDLSQYGTDEDGDGVISPDEIELPE